ncbi:LPXTG cell wall anchor domain-containing protein [Fructobacillus evanidus]|uniref:Gram-positive cocci surface proteins LPxTG domain-containing protein n=1 Tax=Fructobacillus evanidus TaxID=3064281 RepID=A0ABN9YXU0_9LACO|nr:hypothetical protein R54837_OMAIDLJD_01188 [Fructobacillus sp. LMG 32999]CAK1248743.1 hypothetical protein R55214_HHFBAMCI_01196 [Fructobacillus sp. LMG 32999]
MNAAVNGKTIANPTSGNKAGEAAIDSFNKGYQDAVDGKDDSTLTDPVQKAAQAAATNAFNDVKNNTVKTADQIKAMNPVAQVAYQKALTEAQADAAKGAQAYVSGGARPDDSTVDGKATAAGYDKAATGYADGKSGSSAASNDPSYTTGYQAGQSEKNGYNDQSLPDNASQTEKDAYNAAKAGAADGIAGKQPADNSTQSQAYKDAYTKAYQDATNGYNTGYAAGQSGTKPDASQAADPSYMKGYNAGQAAKQAIADDQNGQNNASSSADSTTYNDVQQGYHDGVVATGKTGVNTPNATAANGDAPYQAGYNQAITDTNKARAAAYQDADDNHGQAIDSNKKYSPNSDIQTVAQQAYNDAQTAYSDAISGATTPTNPNDAQASGIAAGTNDKNYVDATVANQAPSATVSSAKSTIVSAQIAAAQAAFKQNPDAKDALNSGDPLANYAYKAEMDALQKQYQIGISDGKAATNAATTASDAEKQGVSDFITGLNAVVNGPTIANPNSGNQAGAAVINSFNQGYQDAEKGTDDSGSGDPVIKAAQIAATDAFNDVKNNTIKTPDEIKTMNPVAQVAYQKALTAAENAASQGAQTYVNGGSRPDNTTVTGKVAAAGYDDAKSGYADGKSGAAASLTNNPSYMTGYNAGLNEKSGYNDQSLPADASQAEKDAYNAAKAGAADGIAGKKPADNSKQSQAYQDAYTQAYNDATNGYNDGYAAGQNGTKPDASQAADPSYMKGYNAGQAAKQAIADEQNGQNNASSSADSTTYNDVQSCYHDGVMAVGKNGADTSPTAPSGDVPYQKGYTQGVQDALAARVKSIQDADDNHGQAIDSNKKYSPNSDIQTVAQQAYNDAQTAYSEAISGATTPTSPNDAQASGITTAQNDQNYVNATVANQTSSATVSSAKSTIVSAQITVAQKAFTANPDAPDSLNSTDPLANYAYKTEMDALQTKYNTGKQEAADGNSPATTASDAEKQGAIDYTNGLNAAVNGQSITNPTSGNKAGEAAIDSFNKGYQDAVAGKDDSSSTDPVQKAAQAAATAAFNDVKNNTVKTPDEIKTMNPVAQVAYQKAVKEAQADAAQGAQAYVNGGSRPDDSTVDGKATAAGYDKAKAGYTDGQSGNNATSTDPSYTTGYNAGKSEASGYDDQKAPADDASQAEKDAYNAAKAGAADGIAGKQPADNSTQSQAYKDAYTKAYQDATNGYNTGYAAGQNGTKPDTSQAADPSYMKGYNAGQAAKQAIADDQNGQNKASSSADSTTYNDAQQGYHDGVIATGKTGVNTPNATSANGDAPYQVAYDQAIKDTNAARALAYQDADDNHGQAIDSNKKYSPNSDIQTVAQQAYNDAQTAYSDAISGATTPTNPNDAQASGAAAGTNDKKFVDATVANQSPTTTVSSAKSGIVTAQISAAQAAFKQNPDASDDLKGADPLANYAYKTEMDSLQAQYDTGKREAAAGTSPASTASDAEKQGAIDYTNGLNAAVNNDTQSITNPNSGNKAGEAAADSFNKGYQDAVAGKDDSNSTDPVQKAAQTAATAAFNDVTKGSVKTPDEIKAMNPVAQVAYQKAEQEAQADAAKGAQAYVSGGARPDDSTVDGKAAAAGYDAAKAGYTDGQSGKTSASTDPSYTTGYNAGKSETAGYNDQSLPANASQAEQDAYNGAKAGAADGTTSATKPSDLSAKSQAYQDAYNKAYADAQAGAKVGYQDGSKSGTPTDISGQDDIYKKAYAAGQATAANEAQAGAKDYVAGKSAPTADTPASHYGYNQAQAGFNDAAAGKSSQSTDSSYTTGYNAEKSAQEAISDAKNGNTSQEQSASDPTAYTDAQQGYHDGVVATGKTGVNTTNATAANGDEPYQVAYDQAIKDTNAARAVAYQDADNDHGQANGSGYKYSANSDVQGVAQQAYTDAQTAYSEAISGATTPTSPNDAQASGIATAKNDQSYVDDTVAGKTPSATVSDAKSTVVSAQITAAQVAFKQNPDASDDLKGTDPLANYAYKVEMDSLQSKYKAGIQDAAAGNSPATTASDAEKQGASDYTAGLNAAVNGQTIANPNSGNKAGEAAADSFNKGYQDAVAGKDDSSSTDPVQKAAQAAATAAFKDVTDGTVKAPDEIKTMNPVAQVAYQKAEQEAQADAAKGAQAYVNGGSRPDDSTVDGKAAAAGYDAAKAGYTDGKSGTAATSNDPSYTTGYNAGKSETSGYDDQKAPAADATQAEKDAYNAAKAGSADGIAGKQPADNSTQSQAYKDAYTKAYQDATTGYNAGYAAGQNGTKPSAAQAADPSYMKGYNAGQAAKQAITDDQNGQNNASSAIDPTTYNDAQQGYHDGVVATGKTFNNTPNATAANGDAPYQVAYDQAIKDTNAARAVAYQDADDNHGQAIDSSKKYSANSDVQAVAQQAYNDAQTAYSEAISGATTPTNPNDAQASGVAAGTNDKNYVDVTVANQTPSATVSAAKSTVVSAQITAAQAAFKQNPDANDSLNGTDPLANYAYKAEMDDLQTKYKAGIQDAAAGTSPAANASDAEKKGASDYTAGLNAAVSGQTITNPTSGNKAGEAAADSFKKGYQDAKNGTDDSSSTDPVQKAAQAAATEAFKDVTNGTVKTPDEINTMDPVAKVAYQKAEQEAETDAAQGAQTYVNGGTRPDDSTVAGKAAAAGYDAAKAGYEDGQNGKATASTNPNYTTGYNAGKSETSGYSDQTAPAANAPQAEQDAYNGAKAGAADGTTSATKPSDLATKSQAYQDAYNKAYADAQAGAKAGYQDGSQSGTPTDLSGKDDIYKNAYNAGKATATDEAESGAKDYVAGKNAPTADTPAGHYGYNQAKAAFADANAGKASQSTDPSYNIGYDASKSEQQAASGSEKGNTNQGQTASDPAAYTDAAKAYASAVTAAQAGNTAATTVTDPVYKQAYDQGLNDAEAARQAAIRDANANHGLNVDPEKVYSGNSAIQLFARKVYAEVQRSYAAVLDGTTPSSPDSAQQQGVATANNDKAYVDATVAGKTPSTTVSDTKAEDVAAAVTAAQKAFSANPDASDDLNGTDPLANYAYKAALDDLQAKYKAGVADAGNINEPGSSADAATQRGANDFNAGLNAALNGQTITNPTSGEKAGEAEAAAFNQGYADAQNGVDDSAAKDPVQKAAQKAATQAFSDSPDFKTDAEVNQMDPVSKAAGYADAQKGYNDAKANVQPTAAEQADANYMKGYQAYKDSQTGYNNAGTQTKPADDAPQPEKDAYNGAIAGVADAVAGKAKESDLATKSQAYQDAYNKAYAAAQAGLNDADSEKSAQSTDPDYMTGYNAGKKHITTVDNTGQSDALSGLAPQDANLNAKDKAAYDEAYSRTIAGLNDGANGVPEAMPNDPNYQKGYAAGEAARALLADKQNNTHTTVADQASYDIAAQAYQQAEDDVANGRPKSPKNQSPVYVLVYDRAYDFLLNEKNQKKTPQPEPAAPVESAPTPAPVLPQTGEQQNVTENSGLVALLLSSILGLVATAKRKRNDK